MLDTLAKPCNDEPGLSGRVYFFTEEYMSENKHTPEPWHMRLSNNATPHIEHGDCYLDEVVFRHRQRERRCGMSALQIWLQNHNRRLTQDAIDEALMEYITHVEKQRDELQEEVNALKERAEYDLAEFARTLDISYDEIKLLKKQRDELLAAAELLLSRKRPGEKENDPRLILEIDCINLEDAIASVKGGQSDDGGSRAGYECPVCRQSDCRGCAKGGAS